MIILLFALLVIIIIYLCYKLCVSRKMLGEYKEENFYLHQKDCEKSTQLKRIVNKAKEAKQLNCSVAHTQFNRIIEIASENILDSNNESTIYYF